MAYGAAKEDGHIGRARANIHADGAQLALVVRQHGQARSQRVEHDLVHLQAAAAHALEHVFGRALRAGDDVRARLQPFAAHAHGFAHQIAVDDEFLRLH